MRKEGVLSLKATGFEINLSQAALFPDEVKESPESPPSPRIDIPEPTLEELALYLSPWLLSTLDGGGGG